MSTETILIARKAEDMDPLVGSIPDAYYVMLANNANSQWKRVGYAAFVAAINNILGDPISPTDTPAIPTTPKLRLATKAGTYTNVRTLKTGSITSTSGSVNIVGVGTAFTTELIEGLPIYSGATLIGTIATGGITDNTHLILAANAAAVVSGVPYNAPIVVGATDGIVYIQYNTTTGFWSKTTSTQDLTNYLTTTLASTTYTSKAAFDPVQVIANRLNPIIKDTTEVGLFWTDPLGYIAAQIVGDTFSALKVKPGTLLLGNDVQIIRGASKVYELKVNGTTVFSLNDSGDVFFNKLSGARVKDNDDYMFAFTNDNGDIAVALTKDRQLLGVTNLGQSTSLNNLKVGVLGDSISTTDFGGLVSGEIYYQLLAAKYNWTMSVSAISGTPIADKSGVANTFVTDARWQVMDDNGTPDLIFVFGGTNDFGAYGIPIGANTDTVTTTFYGALKYLFNSLTTAYKSAKICFILPLHRNRNAPGVLFTIPEKNATTNLYLSQYWDAIKEMASWYGITIINAPNESGLTFNNLDVYSLDGLHPKNTGHVLLANYIEAQLKKIFKP